MEVEILTVDYPYLPKGRTIEYAGPDNPHMALAREIARTHALDRTMPGAAVVVLRDGRYLGFGANGSDYHDTQPCARVEHGIPTGQGYELCEGCHPRNHSEASAVQNAQANGQDPTGADLYLWGHWWCCEPCWSVMIDAGIARVFLLEGSEVLFNKAAPGNIVGRQFQQ